MEGTTCCCEENSDSHTHGSHKRHCRNDDNLDVTDTNDAPKQEQKVELECPDQPDVGVPYHHEPFGPLLAHGSFLWGEGSALLDRQVRLIASSANYMCRNCHRSVRGLESVSLLALAVRTNLPKQRK